MYDYNLQIERGYITTPLSTSVPRTKEEELKIETVKASTYPPKCNCETLKVFQNNNFQLLKQQGEALKHLSLVQDELLNYIKEIHKTIEKNYNTHQTTPSPRQSLHSTPPPQPSPRLSARPVLAKKIIKK